jgi:hypothetical protein
MPGPSRRFVDTSADGTVIERVLFEGTFPDQNKYGHAIRMKTTETSPNGEVQTIYEDVNGNVVQMEYTTSDGSSTNTKYLDATDRWWRELTAPEWGPNAVYQQTIDDVPPGAFPVDRNGPYIDWRNPEEGEEPFAFRSQAQQRGGEPDPPIDLPPALELKNPGTFQGSDGNVHFTATDQHGRSWEWFEDAQGKESVGYIDNAGLRHETSQRDGNWYDTFTDRDGNEHIGQVDQYGNVHDGWTDANGTNHEEVRNPAIEAAETRARMEAEAQTRLEEAMRSDDPQLLEDIAEERGLTLEELKASAEEAGQTPPGDVEPKEGDGPMPPTDPSQEGAPPSAEQIRLDPILGQWFDPNTGLVMDTWSGTWHDPETGWMPEVHAAQPPPPPGYYYGPFQQYGAGGPSNYSRFRAIRRRR